MGEYEPEYEGYEEAAAEPAAEEQFQISREDWEAQQQNTYAIARYLAEQAQGTGQAPPEQPEVPELRLKVNPETGAWESVQEEQPVDPMQTVEQMLEERLAPMAPLLAHVQEQQVEGRIQQAFEAVHANDVQFDDGLARQAAEALAASGRVGTFEDAVRGGIAHAIMTEQRLQQQWQEKQSQNLEALASGRQEPAGSGPAQEARGPYTGQDAYEQTTKAFFAARRAAGRPAA